MVQSPRRRRSRPFLVAPFIPFLGIVGIFGVEQLHGTRYLSAFVVIWCLAFAGLFSYVLERALAARRGKKGKG